MYYFDYIFLSIGFCFSLFYGFRCFEIHKVQKETFELDEKIHQVWFNFFGSAVGWLVFFILYKTLGQISENWSNFSEIILSLRWDHYILVVLGSLGVTGHLPYTLWSISRIPDRFMEQIKKFSEK